ncbi:hypothetical protein HK104_008631 [Borealophlyctis nickersoniae]|nr:hypothetical protein HK104_008631 [Borealophlyctis nickersoniae]
MSNTSKRARFDNTHPPPGWNGRGGRGRPSSRSRSRGGPFHRGIPGPPSEAPRRDLRPPRTPSPPDYRKLPSAPPGRGAGSYRDGPTKRYNVRLPPPAPAPSAPSAPSVMEVITLLEKGAKTPVQALLAKGGTEGVENFAQLVELCGLQFGESTAQDIIEYMILHADGEATIKSSAIIWRYRKAFDWVYPDAYTWVLTFERRCIVRGDLDAVPFRNGLAAAMGRSESSAPAFITMLRNIRSLILLEQMSSAGKPITSTILVQNWSTIFRMASSESALLAALSALMSALPTQIVILPAQGLQLSETIFGLFVDILKGRVPASSELVDCAKTVVVELVKCCSGLPALVDAILDAEFAVVKKKASQGRPTLRPASNGLHEEDFLGGSHFDALCRSRPGNELQPVKPVAAPREAPLISREHLVDLMERCIEGGGMQKCSTR